MRNEVWRKNENPKRFNAILWVRNEMMQKDYKTFITALISIEKDITNQDALDMMYQKFMNTDEMHLLNDEFDEIIEFVLWKELWFNTKILGYNDDIP